MQQLILWAVSLAMSLLLANNSVARLSWVPANISDREGILVEHITSLTFFALPSNRSVSPGLASK